MDNATALCSQCHWYLAHHPSVHKIWKLVQLGQERFEALAQRANTIAKPDFKAIRGPVSIEMKKQMGT
jgi:hypothetical protein